MQSHILLLALIIKQKHHLKEFRLKLRKKGVFILFFLFEEKFKNFACALTFLSFAAYVHTSRLQAGYAGETA
jgi:hypothetical protein